MNETVTIRLVKQAMKFSAAHFTIFSASERERLHGHNFRVEVDIEAHMLGNGMCFDYGIYKDTVIALCRELNEWMILPTRSPYLQIEEQGEHVIAVFNGQRIPGVPARFQATRGMSDAAPSPRTNTSKKSSAGSSIRPSSARICSS